MMRFYCRPPKISNCRYRKTKRSYWLKFAGFSFLIDIYQYTKEEQNPWHRVPPVYQVGLEWPNSHIPKATQVILVITWIESMVVINSQPWGIVYWLVFKRLPVQTTYLFLQAFLKYFYSQEMLTMSEIKFKLHLILTLSVQLQKMTFYEENYGQNELNL